MRLYFLPHLLLMVKFFLSELCHLFVQLLDLIVHPGDLDVVFLRLGLGLPEFEYLFLHG